MIAVKDSDVRRGVSGHVLWPDETSGFVDTGEGGMWAYVFIADEREQGADPFDECHTPGGVVALPVQDVVVRDRGGIYDPRPGMQSYPQLPRHPSNPTRSQDMLTSNQAQFYADALQEYERGIMDAGSNVLAAVCLGSTATSWFSESTGEYFEVTYETLTRQGHGLVDTLKDYFKRTPYYVTYLDT